MTQTIWPATGRVRGLALAAALATFALIVAGGFVRASGSQLGCAGAWPGCGALDWPAVVELTHRALTLTVAPLVIGLALLVWRRDQRARWPALAAVVLLAAQIALGAAGARLVWPPYLASLHLATALAQLGALVAVTLETFQPAAGRGWALDAVSLPAVILAAGVGALIVAGSLVTAAHSGAACAGWPLCNGSLWPTTPGEALALGHRYLALAVGALLLVVLRQVWRWRPDDVLLWAASALLATLFLGQVLVGGRNVTAGLPTFINGLHIATSAAVWAAAVAVAVSALHSAAAAPVSAPPAASARGSWGDYLALTKPIIMLLLLTTTAASMVVAGHGWPPADIFWWTMLGGALASGGASALNQVIDRDLDQHMARTSRRPMASGRVSLAAGLAFSLALSVASFYVLAVFVNPAAAVLAMTGHLYYVLGYTILLKKATAQNIVIGGGAGAIPALVGWAAATGRINLPAVFLFALVFYWTPPHFWALALLKKNDYARAGVPMLPVVWNELETRRQIFWYTLVVVALSLLLTPARVAGVLYLAAAGALGAFFIYYAWRLLSRADNRAAWQLYRYSSMYLALIFAALVIDRLVS